MKGFVKGIPFLLACILAYTIFRFAGEDPPHISASTLKRLQALHPNGEVAPVYSGRSIQYEAYGKPAKRQFRVQSFGPGNLEFYDANGKTVLRLFVEQGDVLITVPRQTSIEAYGFDPFEWLE